MRETQSIAQELISKGESIRSSAIDETLYRVECRTLRSNISTLDKQDCDVLPQPELPARQLLTTGPTMKFYGSLSQ